MFDLKDYAQARNFIMARFKGDKIQRMAFGAGLQDAIALALVIADPEGKSKSPRNDREKAMQEGMLVLANVLSVFVEHVGSPSNPGFGIDPSKGGPTQQDLEILDDKIFTQFLTPDKKPKG